MSLLLKYNNCSIAVTKEVFDDLKMEKKKNLALQKRFQGSLQFGNRVIYKKCKQNFLKILL